MAEYIDKEKLIADIVNTGITDYKTLPFEVAALFIECVDRQNEIMAIIERQPTAEVEPVRHGYWKWVGGVPYCSVCGEAAPGDPYDGAVYTTSRCPNCGARMDGGTENG